MLEVYIHQVYPEKNCNRSVYAGFENGQLQSVLQVQHCLKEEETEGSYSWKRSEDTDADGKIDSCYGNYERSYIGGSEELPPPSQCAYTSYSQRDINSVLMDALQWARYP